MSKQRFMAFADTIESPSCLLRSPIPLTVLENIRGGLSMEKQSEIRRLFGINSNQLIRLERIYDVEHYLIGDSNALCGVKTKKRGRLKPSQYQGFEDFVNCPECVRIMEEAQSGRIREITEIKVD